MFIEHPENKKIICWDKDDVGFIVLDMVSFTKEILPKYFRHSNFSSFVRQVPLPNPAQYVRFPQSQTGQ